MEAQAAEALECHLVSDLSILQNTDGCKDLVWKSLG